MYEDQQCQDKLIHREGWQVFLPKYRSNNEEETPKTNQKRKWIIIKKKKVAEINVCINLEKQ